MNNGYCLQEGPLGGSIDDGANTSGHRRGSTSASFLMP
jgi:hypothetical protein